MRCTTCRDSDYIQAPANNSWRVYFSKIGCSHYNVLVPCPACGGIDGKLNRRDLAARLEERKRAGTFPAQAST
jgi:hypothetical protein